MKFRSLLVAVAFFALPGLALPSLALAGGLHVVTKTLTAKSGTYDISVAYPQTGVKAIDDDMAAWARKAVADFRSESSEDHQVGENPYDLETTFTVQRNDGQVFAVLFEEYTDTGGAHPNHDYYAANYLMPDGWRIYLPELLDGSRGLRRIADLAQTDLTRRITKGSDALSDPDTVKSGTRPYWDNFRSFILMPGSIALSFPPYQVASYASGPQESRIPLASLRDVMRLDPRKPAASFDCDKAQTAVEQLLCSDVALARLDREVSETYAVHLRDGNDAATQASLRTNQRAWLASRDRTCGPAGARAACLTDYYRQRLAWFGHQP